MTRWMGAFVLAVAVVGPASSIPPRAEPSDAPPADEPGEVRQEMPRNFVTRLRSELDLTDAQMAALTPEIEALERTRLRDQQERRKLGLELRKALDGGAGDEEIQALLDRFDEASARHERELRERVKKIDASLTVRQRAELRFFLTRFRQDLERRVRDFRSTGRRPTRR